MLRKNRKMHEKISANIESEERPEFLTTETVIKWSNTYKRLEMLEKDGKFKTYSIRKKALRFVENECIDYDREKKCFICNPIPGYNSTKYEIKNNYKFSSGFECNCQFHQKVVVDRPELMCSHCLALLLQLKIWNWKK